MLCVAAVVSLVLGLYQDFGTKPVPIACQDGTLACFAPRVDWVEGVAIMVAVIIVVVVGSLNDWQKEKQFKVLNSKKEERGVKVVRSGREAQINVHVCVLFPALDEERDLTRTLLQEVLVGDVCLLEPGEIVPCDGILLRGHNVRTDESDITGESDLIKKAPYEECLKERDLKQDIKHDCFIVSGTKVVEGVGAYVVVAVGKKSLNGRIMICGSLFRRCSSYADEMVLQRYEEIQRTRLYKSSLITSQSSLRNWEARLASFSSPLS
jgi:Ca2+-transporting ATPase